MGETGITILTTLITMAVAAGIVAGAIFLNRNWNWIVLGHHPDTLRIRCEEEQGGTLIGNVCVRKDAVLWRAK